MPAVTPNGAQSDQMREALAQLMLRERARQMMQGLGPGQPLPPSGGTTGPIPQPTNATASNMSIQPGRAR